MDNVLRQIEIDLYSTTSYEVIKAQQGDKNSRVIEFVLYNQGKPYELTNNISFRFVGHRGDGSSFSKNEEQCITRNENHVKVTLLEDILYYDGIIESKLVMYESSSSSTEQKVLSTIPFKISCIKNPCNENNLTEGEKSIVTDLIFQVEEFSKTASEIIREAKKSADIASSKALEASNSANKAKESENKATVQANKAKNYADSAEASKNSAIQSENNANIYAKAAQSYAVGNTDYREDEENDCAKYYYEQSKRISESFSGALRPMGTVSFNSLPSLSLAKEGDMYNISNQFTTTASFEEGSGNIIPAGSNIYKTANEKWDVLAGSPVTGLKGNAESAYRKGNVNITPANIGLGNVGNYKAVSTVASQKLTEEEKESARENIEALPFKRGFDDRENTVKNSFGNGVYNSFVSADENPEGNDSNHCAALTLNPYHGHSGSYSIQIGAFGSSNSNPYPNLYMRHGTDDYDEKKWGSWTKFISENDLFNGIILDAIYPIGSIYMSVNAMNPSKLFGGSWEQWGNGRVPVGVNTSETEFNAVEKTGGEKTHILTTAEIPAHNHSVSEQSVTTTQNGSHQHKLKYNMSAATTGSAMRILSSGDSESNGMVVSDGNHTHSVTIPKHTTANNANGGGAHNNLQPYITCYMWKRTA